MWESKIISSNALYLHFCMNLDTKFNGIDIDIDGSIMHYFIHRKTDCSSSQSLNSCSAPKEIEIEVAGRRSK